MGTSIALELRQWALASAYRISGDAAHKGVLEGATGHFSGHPGGGEAVSAHALSVPTNLRRYYAELNRFPQGFLVYGDALCSFNPVYGQGMTVAIMESLALRQCLAAGIDDIARRFFRAADRLIDIPWKIAVGSDLQHPGVQGKRPAQLRFFNWYIAQLFWAAQTDAVLATRFLEVLNLTRQPASLLEPRMALRVWRGNRQRARDR
jgi:2-polyprenyl-6-methoxyphenol hydroxylase-like FAD-dependent oxidoreductase